MSGKELESLVLSRNLTVSAAADLLGISRQTLYAWYKKELIPESDQNHINKVFGINPYKTSDNEARFVNEGDFMEVEFLPISAQAGYLDSLESQLKPTLDTMLIPTPPTKGNYKIVEISGDSMNDDSPRAILDRDKLLVKELQRHLWASKLHFRQRLFVLAGRDGMVCKEIIAHDVENGILTCHSWNPMYNDYQVSMEDLYQIFYVEEIVARKVRF